MTTLIMMYVFYDANGDIKAIAPNPESNLSSQFQCTTFPMDDVSGFLNLQKNPYNYYIKEIKSPSGKSYRIIKKETIVHYFRTLDNCLTRVDEKPAYEPFLIIRNILKNKVFEISTSTEFKNMKMGITEEQEEVNNFLARTELTLYATKHNNPYHLLQTIKFSPKAVIDDKFYFNYDKDLSNISIYTKKVISSYRYFESKPIGKK